MGVSSTRFFGQYTDRLKSHNIPNMRFLGAFLLAGAAVAMTQNKELAAAKVKLDSTLQKLYNTHAAGHVDGAQEVSDQITAIFASGVGTVAERKSQVYNAVEQGLKKYNVGFSFAKLEGQGKVKALEQVKEVQTLLRPNTAATWPRLLN